MSIGYPGSGGKKAAIGEMIRVNHAGEYGAQRIYAGQLAVLGHDSEAAALIGHMKAQETAHLRFFEGLMTERRVRPSALLPLWHVGGWALGAATAFLGKEAAMACTVAVEREISAHYAQQEADLATLEEEKELAQTITRFRAEEEEHHDIGVAHDAKNAPLNPLLEGAVGAITRLAVQVAKKL